MRFLILAAVGAFADPSVMDVQRWLKADPNSPEMQAARKQEVSFLQNTLHAMEFNQQEVVKSNKELDKQVKESERRLRKITEEVNRMTKDTRERMDTVFPFSLVEKDGDDDDDDDNDRKPASFLQTKSMGDGDDTGSGSPVIIEEPDRALKTANARAAASEQKFREAMRKLEADRQALLQDERMRRARAQQERRHIHG